MNGLKLVNNGKLENIEVNMYQDWYSIRRVSALNGVSWRTFKWFKLKTAGEKMGYEIKTLYHPNFGIVNVYHKDVWAAVYPDYEL